MCLGHLVAEIVRKGEQCDLNEFILIRLLHKEFFELNLRSDCSLLLLSVNQMTHCNWIQSCIPFYTDTFEKKGTGSSISLTADEVWCKFGGNVVKCVTMTDFT